MNVAAATSLLRVVSLASCGESSSEEPNQDAVDVEGALDEYRDAQSELVLAPGASWPADTPILKPSADAGMFEYGVGLQEAQTVWYCSWAREAISGNGDEQAALDMLTEFPEQFGPDGKYTKGSDSLRQGYDNMEKAAALGDLSPLQQHISLNCPALDFDE